jgi:hypothetical protein
MAGYKIICGADNSLALAYNRVGQRFRLAQWLPSAAFF